jgi:phosphate-selective porin OprO/OprP
MKKVKTHWLVFPLIALSFINTTTAQALESSAWCNPLQAVVAEERTPASLYNNPENPWIQQFNFTLRLQYQVGFVDSHETLYPGSQGFEDEFRRVRAGWNMKFLDHWKIVNIWNLGGLDGFGWQANDVWHHHRAMTGNLYDLHLQYETDDVLISVGKNFPAHLLEFRDSSGDYIIPEYAAVEESVRGDNSYGIIVKNSKKDDKLGWVTGLWSGTVTGLRQAWTSWETPFSQVELSYACRLPGMEKGRVYFDWLHSYTDMDHYRSSSHSGKYTGIKAQDIFALYYRGTSGPFGLWAEALWGRDPMSRTVNGTLYQPADIYGVIVTPTWMLTDHIQAVSRFQWGKGTGAIKLNQHYTALTETSGNYVDKYQAFAVGFNFYAYAKDLSKMKIMTLAEYSHSERKHGASGFTGWTWIVGAYFDI